MRRVMLAAVLLAGCDDEEMDCGLLERNGTYLFTYFEISGNCGPLGAAVGRIDNSAPVMGCSLEVPDRVSTDECILERTIVCEAESIGPGFTTKTVAISEQQDDDADLITGTFSIFLFDGDGIQLCGSTYDVEATRQ